MPACRPNLQTQLLPDVGANSYQAAGYVERYIEGSVQSRE